MSETMEIYENLSVESLPNEEWRDIIGWEGLYQVSNLGRVKSLPRLHKYVHGEYLSKERILSPRVCGSQREYLSVALYRGKGAVQRKIHRLVAMAFISNPKGYKEVNHIDENKRNNMASNLEWCSRSYNVNYGRRIEKQSAHLQKAVLAFTRRGQFVARFKSIKDAAVWAGVDGSNVSRAIKRDSVSGGYKWRFENE